MLPSGENPRSTKEAESPAHRTDTLIINRENRNIRLINIKPSHTSIIGSFLRPLRKITAMAMLEI
jgi:hypothetical protein